MIDHPFFSELSRHFTDSEIIASLTPFLTKERLEKIETILSSRLNGVHLAVESPADLYNALAMVRSAEAFGVMQMHIITSEIRRRSGKKTSQGTSRWVNIHYHNSLDSFTSIIKKHQIALYGAVVDSNNTPDDLDLSRPCCLLFGNEQRGLSEEAKTTCDQLFTIPTVGMVESLNLSVATGISLYALFRKKQTQGLISSFDQKELDHWKAYYILQSLGLEKSKKILKHLFKSIERNI
ncbi:MAG: RNA methyltransferase [Simkaniaceae bacterium]|nr:RNA methyltransferase [Simkaniaceae bacterium]